jgi:tetratricopeptide (TPR) repeat protein
VLFQEEEDPQLIRAIPAKDVQVEMTKQRGLALGHVPTAPAHGFIGRSRELMAAERILARERYVVLMGEGGEGKTTLAAELARWLVLTQRFARAAFVPFDKIPDARAALLSLVEQLVPSRFSEAAADAKLARQLVDRALAEQSTVIVFDNMESVLPLAADSKEVLDGILALAGELTKVGDTRIVFTSREALPEPFHRNRAAIGRLERSEAIRLVGRVLGEGNRMPGAASAAQSEQEIEALVEAVGCHARALVLLAGEVAASGVTGATEKLHELMARLEAKHPGERERSLLASVELSLQRLPADTRERIRPLGVFQGGASTRSVYLTLELEPAECVGLLRNLVGVGLAEELAFEYFRFDPALAPTLLARMSDEDGQRARDAWIEAVVRLSDFLYEQQFENADLAYNLARLELANLVAGLDYLARSASPERIVHMATRLESIVASLGNQPALAWVLRIRARAAQGLGEWSHETYLSGSANVDRLRDQGRSQEAVHAAEILHRTAEAAGESAYDGAAYDLAMSIIRLGRALKESAAADKAIPYLEASRTRFQKLGAVRMGNVALVEIADCHADLGEYEAAALEYEESIRIAEEIQDARQVATNKGQLGRVRMFQNQYKEALDAYEQTREIFTKLGEPPMVAVAWHLIAIVHEKTGQYEAAEKAYQESLKIKVQTKNRGGEAQTLNQLGNLYSQMERYEDAVCFHRQAADLNQALGDLRGEGMSRSNLAVTLIQVERYCEARREIIRAIECNSHFGHVAQPWKTFAILCDLELAEGNQSGTHLARERAIQAYLAYSRDGGEPQTDWGRTCMQAARDPETAAALLAQLQQQNELPLFWQSVRAVLAGSRDLLLAADPNLDYDEAVELRLLIEALQGSS